MLDHPRWERFAQEIATGASRREAYRAAGYKGDAEKSMPDGVANRPCVKQRIKELQADRLERACQRKAAAAVANGIDLAWLQKMGAYIMFIAIEERQLSTASLTLERIAKMSGVWMLDNSAEENDNVLRIYSDRPLTEEEWLRMYAPHNLEDPDDAGDDPEPSN